MRAIILAAGEGVRLRPLTADRPKCLVHLAGRPILERIVGTLRDEGIDDVTVVTGYRADAIEALGYRTCRNPRYASTNMVHSLFCARDRLVGDDVLVVYGDIVFSRAVAAAVIASDAPFGVVVDRAWRRLWEARMPDPLADAETLRVDPDGSIRELGKKPRGYEDIEGQFVGLLRIARTALPEVLAFHDALDPQASYDGRDLRNMFMTSFVQAVIDRLMPVQAIWIDGGWVEVDSVDDLKAYERRARDLLSWLDPA